MNPFIYTYKNPEAFFLFALMPLFVLLYYWIKAKKQKSMRTGLGNVIIPLSTGNWVIHLPLVLRVTGLCFLIIALARPVNTQPDDIYEEYGEGIDIVLAFDISTSMLARDFKPDRLTAAKEVATRFISKRKNDRIGLVVYGSEAFTMCPLTSDHSVLIASLDKSEPGIIEGGTAVGMGLAIAINRLRESTSKSKVIILLTDGVNNSGNIDPQTAALIAKEYGIRVYTIGVGSQGTAMSPIQTPMGTIDFAPMKVEIDEDLLRYVAEQTNGKYYRATNKNKLEEIYNEIDQLEKSKLNLITFHKDDIEMFYLFAWLAGGIILLEWILSKTIMRSVFA
jgi:Ca-activated chloride channel family protein